MLVQGSHLLRGVWSLSRNHEAGSPRRSAPSYGHLQGDGAAVFAPACPFHLTFGLTKEGVMLPFQQLAGGQLPVTRHQEKERITRFAYVGGGISDYLSPRPVAVLLYRALS